MGTQKQKSAARQVIGVFSQAGFSKIESADLSGAYVVEFVVNPTEPWEKRNMRSSMHISRDGNTGEVSVRMPAAPRERERAVRSAAETALRAADASSMWYVNISDKDGFGDRIKDVRPHLVRSINAPTVSAKTAARNAVDVVRAYRRVI